MDGSLSKRLLLHGSVIIHGRHLYKYFRFRRITDRMRKLVTMSCIPCSLISLTYIYVNDSCILTSFGTILHLGWHCCLIFSFVVVVDELDGHFFFITFCVLTCLLNSSLQMCTDSNHFNGEGEWCCHINLIYCVLMWTIRGIWLSSNSKNVQIVLRGMNWASKWNWLYSTIR